MSWKARSPGGFGRAGRAQPSGRPVPTRSVVLLAVNQTSRSSHSKRQQVEQKSKVSRARSLPQRLGRGALALLASGNRESNRK